MTGAGIVGIGAAYANYNQAKKDYDALIERREGMMAAVETYESTKLDAYIESLNNEPVDLPTGLRFSTVLRIGNLVGKYFRVQTSLVVSNVSKEKYFVGNASAECKVLDAPVLVYSGKIISEGAKQLNQQVRYDNAIEPGETVEIFMPAGISSLGDKMSSLRDMFCEANGKKYITSCPKTTISKGEVADVLFQWRKDGEDGWKMCKALNRPGALRYCGEAYYPG